MSNDSNGRNSHPVLPFTHHMPLASITTEPSVDAYCSGNAGVNVGAHFSRRWRGNQVARVNCFSGANRCHCGCAYVLLQRNHHAFGARPRSSSGPTLRNPVSPSLAISRWVGMRRWLATGCGLMSSGRPCHLRPCWRAIFLSWAQTSLGSRSSGQETGCTGCTRSSRACPSSAGLCREQNRARAWPCAVQ